MRCNGLGLGMTDGSIHVVRMLDSRMGLDLSVTIREDRNVGYRSIVAWWHVVSSDWSVSDDRCWSRLMVCFHNGEYAAQLDNTRADRMPEPVQIPAIGNTIKVWLPVCTVGSGNR